MTLALSSFNHAKCFSAKLLPFLALRLAGGLSSAGDDVSGGALGKVLTLNAAISVVVRVIALGVG